MRLSVRPRATFCLPSRMGAPMAATKRRAAAKAPRKTAKARSALDKEYYSNGNLSSVGRHIDGKRDGPWKFYHRDGKLWSTGTFRNGEAVGLFKWYAENGKLRQSGRFDQTSKQTGLWKRYYGGTNQIFDIGKFEAGKKVGTWKVYDKKGNVKRAQTFRASKR